jgi:uncharacterized protein YmfQ (DUF2313 family)
VGLMSVGSVAEYKASLERLLPHGEFWERQLQDTSSDLSLFLSARAEELRRYRLRCAALADEAVVDSASETLDDWERVANLDNHNLGTNMRRSRLLATKVSSLSGSLLAQVAAVYGATIVKSAMPFHPAIFGYSRFGCRLATPAAFNIVYLYVDLADASIRSLFENAIESVLLASYTTIFFYRTATNEYVSG